MVASGVLSSCAAAAANPSSWESMLRAGEREFRGGQGAGGPPGFGRNPEAEKVTKLR